VKFFETQCSFRQK